MDGWMDMSLAESQLPCALIHTNSSSNYCWSQWSVTLVGLCVHEQCHCLYNVTTNGTPCVWSSYSIWWLICIVVHIMSMRVTWSS